MTNIGWRVNSILLAIALEIAGAMVQAGSDQLAGIPPPEVSTLVAPVLNAHYAVSVTDNEATEKPLEQALEKVLQTKNSFGNEALAILLGYYVGEASGEQISCELVSRGHGVIS